MCRVCDSAGDAARESDQESGGSESRKAAGKAVWMMQNNRELVKIQIKALQVLKKDYEKLYERALKKRKKEMEKLQSQSKIGQLEWDKDSLQEAYGWGQITQSQYDSLLTQLRESEDKKVSLQSVATVLTEYLKMLKQEINNVSMEIEELGALQTDK